MKKLETCACPDIELQSNLSACVQTSCPFQDQIRKKKPPSSANGNMR